MGEVSAGMVDIVVDKTSDLRETEPPRTRDEFERLSLYSHRCDLSSASRIRPRVFCFQWEGDFIRTRLTSSTVSSPWLPIQVGTENILESIRTITFLKDETLPRREHKGVMCDSFSSLKGLDSRPDIGNPHPWPLGETAIQDSLVKKNLRDLHLRRNPMNFWNQMVQDSAIFRGEIPMFRVVTVYFLR